MNNRNGLRGLGLFILLGFCAPGLCQDLLAGAEITIAVVPAFSSQPDSGFKHLGKDAVLKIAATPGEIESASLIITAGAEVNSATIELSDFIAGNAELPGSIVDVRYVKSWYQGSGAWRSARFTKPYRPVLIPELLLKDPSLVIVDTNTQTNYLRGRVLGQDYLLDISSQEPGAGGTVEELPDFFLRDADSLVSFSVSSKDKQRLWLNVAVPENAVPGMYNSSIRVRNRNGELASMPIQLEVLPFVLQNSGLTYSLYYRGQLANNAARISSELKSEDQLLRELQNIAVHGISAPVVFQGNSNPATRNILPEVRKPKVLDKYLEIFRSAGLRSREMFFAGYGTSAANKNSELQRLDQRVRRVVGQARNYGFDEVYFAGIDEASGERLRSQQKAWRQVRASGAKVFVANNKHDIGTVRQLPDVAVMARKLRPDEARQLQSQGTRVFSYNNPQSAVENPSLFRRNYGFALIGANYDGAMIYAYQHGFGSVWNDFDSKRFRDHCLTYPTSKGVIDTIAWEALREAVDDSRYYETARKLIELLGPNHDSYALLVRTLESILMRVASNDSWEADDIREEIISLTRATIAAGARQDTTQLLGHR